MNSRGLGANNLERLDAVVLDQKAASRERTIGASHDQHDNLSSGDEERGIADNIGNDWNPRCNRNRCLPCTSVPLWAA